MELGETNFGLCGISMNWLERNVRAGLKWIGHSG